MHYPRQASAGVHATKKSVSGIYMSQNIAVESNKILAFPINVEAVLLHLFQDMRDDWFPDALQHRDLFSNKVGLGEILDTLLLEGNGQYKGAERRICDIPKKGHGIRYSLETDFYDRFIYQAICSYLIPFYDPLLSHRVLGHRYNKHRHSEKYLFKGRIELWRTFEGVTRTALQNNQALFATDLVNYFENISVEGIKVAFEGMLGRISASGPQKVMIRNAIQTLCELMTKWAYSERHGLPQNRDASSFIANVVLNSVDQEMVALGHDYYRYVDDIRIISSNVRAARKVSSVLVGKLRAIGMNINSAKTRILTSESSDADLADFFPTSDDRSLTVDSMWKSRSRRVIARSARYIYQIIKDCIDSGQTQSRQFRFAVNRLIMLTDAKLFNVHEALASELKLALINSLEDHAVSTDQYCRLLDLLDLTEDELGKICEYLCDHERSIFSWQNYHLWFLLARRKYKTENLLKIAKTRLTNDVLQPEVAAIFIYLRCVNEAEALISVVQQFKENWPYYHQRNFLLATVELDRDSLRPIIEKLGTKIRGTATRARSHFTDGLPLVEREATPILDIFDDINPYD